MCMEKLTGSNLTKHPPEANVQIMCLLVMFPVKDIHLTVFPPEVESLNLSRRKEPLSRDRDQGPDP